MDQRSGYYTKVAPFLDDIREMVKAGVRDKKIAVKLGVGITTLRRYKREQPELAEAMQRLDNYEARVKPHLAEIEDWSITMTQGEIAAKCGVSRSAWDDYINMHEELAQALHIGHEKYVQAMRNKMRDRAFGYMYTEKKTTQRKGSDGKMQAVVEIYERERPADIVALHMLLKNNDPTWRDDDFETLQMKKKQLEIAQQKADNAEW